MTLLVSEHAWRAVSGCPGHLSFFQFGLAKNHLGPQRIVIVIIVVCYAIVV